IADIDPLAAHNRHQQGWLTDLDDDLEKVISRSKTAVENKEAISIGYLGNIVDLLEYLVKQNITPDLASDQTSLHNPWLGGYMPVGITFEDGREMIINDPDGFKNEVKRTLRKHVDYVNQLTERGTIFWDYGNAFLLESSRAGAAVI
ncbi:MAG: urocanate hydratase, partial [Euryarchaeota archaeon]